MTKCSVLLKLLHYKSALHENDDTIKWLNHSARSLKLTFQHITDLHLDHNLPSVSHSAACHWFSDGGPCFLQDKLSCCSASNEMRSDGWWQTHQGNRCVTDFDTTISTNSLRSDSLCGWVRVNGYVQDHYSKWFDVPSLRNIFCPLS